ncbi:ATP-binding protein [Janibacter sp. Y6]|uniref:ATP-binding protein n=1 Tax=Janibacter sp. Y6 TaxID=2913552 RepID=UPI0034A549D2
MSPRDTVARVLERLVLLLSAVILAISLLSAGAVVYIRHEVTTTATRFTPLIDASSRIRLVITDAQSEYRGYLLTRDPRYLDRYRADRAEFRKETTAFREIAPGEVGGTQMDALVEAGEKWFSAVDVQVARVASGRPGRLASTAGTFDQVETAHDELVAEVSAAREDRRDRYRAAMSISLVAIILASLVALSTTLRQSWKVRRYLTSPLRSLYSTVVNHEAGAVAARADTTRGAQEVRAVATAFNSLAEVNDSMRRERERQLDLYRLTSRVVGQLSRRDDETDGTWDDACRELSARLGVDATTIYEIEGDEIVTVGSYRSPSADFTPLLVDISVPALREMLADVPALFGHTPDEIFALFPDRLAGTAGLHGVRAWVLHPLVVSGEVVGILSIAAMREHHWEASEEQAIRRVAEYAGHALAERRVVAELSALDAQKSDFVATTSHELRTPLTSIAGYLELIEDGDFGPLQPRQAHALEVISRNVSRLRLLIDELLLLNRLDSGAAGAERRVLDMRLLVTSVGESMKPVADAAGVELVVSTGTHSQPVEVERDQVERAIGNLTSNGVKFTPRGGRVELRIEADDAWVRVICRDTGMGIPDEDQAHLFQRFYRASNAREQQVQGTGLGLVIVETIARMHGGRVVLESSVGVGTTVTVTLPRAGSAHASAEPASPGTATA